MLTTSLFKKVIVAKSKQEKIECNLVEHYMEGYGSKRAVLPMMMLMMMMTGHVIKNYSVPDLRGSDRGDRPGSSMKQKWDPKILFGYLIF
jgi:hypothetical protein